MVEVVDGMRASVLPEKQVEEPKTRVGRKQYSGRQQARSVFGPLSEGETVRVFVDDQEYEIARVG